MMPIKINFPIQKDDWWNIAIVGIGKMGREAVESLSQKAYQLCRDVDVLSLFLTDDADFTIGRACEEIKHADVLFSIVDGTEEKGVQTAYEMAKDRDGESSICICYGEYSESLKQCYDNLVLIDDDDLLDAVPILIANMMRRGLVGVDFADVFCLLRETPLCVYEQFNLTNAAEIGKVFKKKPESIVNALVHITTPPSISLEDVNEIITALYEVFQGPMVWNTHEDESCEHEGFQISMVYGKDGELL